MITYLAVTHGSTMAKPQTHWFNAETAAITTGAQKDNTIFMEKANNVHGLRAEINIESEVMDANSNGHWVVYALPGDIIDSADFLNGWNQFDDEEVTQYIWGAGLWMASNQTPYHHIFSPATTRNLPKNGRIVLTVHVEGTVPILSNNRINTLLSFFTTS